MTLPLLGGIHHVAIIASDYERSRHFYHQVLGLPILAETLREARHSWKLDLALPDGSQLELFSFPAPPPRPSRPEACGLRHLAFRVQVLDPVIAHLERDGIRPQAQDDLADLPRPPLGVPAWEQLLP